MKRKAGTQKGPKSSKKGKMAPPSRTSNLRFQANTVGGSSELKNVDIVGTVSTSGAGNFVAPAAGQLLNGLAQGTTENQRVGRKVVFKSLLFNFFYSDNSLTTADAFRILVVYDKQPIGVFPAITDILATSSVLSPMNLSYSDRFTVLANREINPSTVQTSPLGAFYVKLGLDGIYSSTGALVANINTGAIYVMVASTNSGAIGILNFYSRVRYTDA